MQDILIKFGKYILMAVIALISFFSGATTDIGQAFQIAIDKDKAIVQAVTIINDTPKTELKEAIKEAE